jgi:membrane protease subunit HflC
MKNPIVVNLVRLLALMAIVIILLPFWVFTVTEREMAVVLRFGKPVREFTEPGVRFRVPMVETVRILPKTQLFWGDQRQFVLPDLPTKDDKKIELIPWAVWRIKEPTVFVQRLRTVPAAEQRVAQITRSAIRDVLTKYDLAEIVRSTDRAIPTSSDYSMTAEELKSAIGDELSQSLDSAMEPVKPGRIQVGREKILEIIKLEATKRLLNQSDDEDMVGRGIELVDVGISQVDFVKTVRLKTFDRWIAERESVSARNINEGERLKAKIVNEAKAETARIEGEGQKIANTLRGDVDAWAIEQYAKVIEEVGEFYTFTRTLEAYETALGKDSRMILTTDSDFFRMLKMPSAAPGDATSAPDSAKSDFSVGDNSEVVDTTAN